jgi:hypothetical protein
MRTRVIWFAKGKSAKDAKKLPNILRALCERMMWLAKSDLIGRRTDGKSDRANNEKCKCCPWTRERVAPKGKFVESKRIKCAVLRWNSRRKRRMRNVEPENWLGIASKGRREKIMRTVRKHYKKVIQRVQLGSNSDIHNLTTTDV